MSDHPGAGGGGVPAVNAEGLAPADDIRLARARSILARVLAGRSTLRMVAVALGMDVEALPAHPVERRLAIFRAYVGIAVQTASPLVMRVCEMNGVSLDRLVTRLRPAMVWDQWLCGVRPHDAWLRSLSGSVNASDAPAAMRDEWRMQEWLHSGWPVYGGEDLRLLFGVRVLDAGLEMAASPGGHRLRTHGSEGSITLRMTLPDTVMCALPGRALDCLIDHPLINGAGCMVTGVDEPTAKWGTKVRFALDPVAWRMPWARVTADGTTERTCGKAAAASGAPCTVQAAGGRAT